MGKCCKEWKEYFDNDIFAEDLIVEFCPSCGEKLPQEKEWCSCKDSYIEDEKCTYCKLPIRPTEVKERPKIPNEFDHAVLNPQIDLIMDKIDRIIRYLKFKEDHINEVYKRKG